MDKGIQRAEEKMEYVSIDKEALRVYQMREMAMSDWTSGLNHARREGMQEGIQEGIQKGMQEGIQKGIQEGIQKGIQEGIQKGMQEGIQKGMQEGIQKGMQEGMRKIAAAMKRRGAPIDQIAEDTGLSVEDIAKL
jgi:flagellar biosynthesis/type III secretory pathway protein FliH